MNEEFTCTLLYDEFESANLTLPYDQLVVDKCKSEFRVEKRDLKIGQTRETTLLPNATHFLFTKHGYFFGCAIAKDVLQIVDLKETHGQN